MLCCRYSRRARHAPRVNSAILDPKVGPPPVDIATEGTNPKANLIDVHDMP